MEKPPEIDIDELLRIAGGFERLVDDVARQKVASRFPERSDEEITAVFKQTEPHSRMLIFRWIIQSGIDAMERSWTPVDPKTGERLKSKGREKVAVMTPDGQIIVSRRRYKNPGGVDSTLRLKTTNTPANTPAPE